MHPSPESQRAPRSAGRAAEARGASSPLRPAVVAFDTIETLASLDPVADVLEHAGLPDEALELFFGRVLRDAFALELGGVRRPFEDLARTALGTTLEVLEHGPDDALVDRVVGMFASLPLHADARAAIERLRADGIRVLALTNAARDATEQILRLAGVLGSVEAVISPEVSGHYKPSREAYLHAARALETVPGHILVVAAHSWDVHGAKEAGLGAAWVRRQEPAPNPLMAAPDLRGADLLELAEAISSLPRRATHA